MKYVFASYVYSPEYHDPEAWIKHVGFYFGILEALAETDTVATIEQIDYEGAMTNCGVEYYFKKYSHWERRLPFRMHRFVKKLRPDVVVIQSLHFPLQVLLLRLMLGRKVKIIIQNHAEKPFKGIKRWLQRLAEQATDAYLFASKPMGLGWIEQGNLTNADKIHEVMEVSSVFKPMDRHTALKQTDAAGEPVFLWVGRLNANKDPLNVIKSFLRYTEIQPSARLYMIYHTDELLPEINRLLNSDPNGDHIILIGKVAHNELAYWYNSADFVISGSYYEGSGTAICEAMSCGCLPIVTDIDSFKMITDHGRCGTLYEAGNEEALFEVLKATVQMDLPAKREQVLQHYSATLSFGAIAKRFREITAASSV